MVIEIDMKKCKKCGTEKELTEFNKRKKSKDGLRGECKSCWKEYQKEHYLDNKEKIKEIKKQYYLDNKENIKQYRLENKEKKNEYRKNRKNNDPLYKLTTNLRSMLYKSFNNKGYKKTSKSQEILGCSFDELKTHIESQFEDWMNWDKQGNPEDGILEPNKTWDIDHIIPLSTATTEEELIKLNHYTNLQPLCSYVNRFIKKDNLDY